MAERDITGRAVLASARILTRARERLRLLIPLGPSQVRLAPAELRKLLAQGNTDMLSKYIQQRGVEDAIAAMTGASTPGPNTLEEFVNARKASK